MVFTSFAFAWTLFYGQVDGLVAGGQQFRSQPHHGVCLAGSRQSPQRGFQAIDIARSSAIPVTVPFRLTESGDFPADGL